MLPVTHVHACMHGGAQGTGHRAPRALQHGVCNGEQHCSSSFGQWLPPMAVVALSRKSCARHRSRSRQRTETLRTDLVGAVGSGGPSPP